MLLRRLSPFAVALFAASCAPSVPGPDSTQPSSVDIAVFDPANSKLPQPNDLDFQQLPTLTGAAKDLLGMFYAQGGFPSDQDTPATIDLQHQALPTAAGPGPNTAPDFDPTKVVACPAANCNVAVFEQTSPTVQPALVPVDASYVATAADHGTLYLRAKKHALSTNPSIQTGRWTPGAKYVVAVRGGSSGLTTKSGNAINPSPTFFLLTRDVDLSQPQNQTLIPGTAAQKQAAGTQLEALRQNYLPAFGLVDMVFPHRDLAVLSTFKIAPARPTVFVEFDQAAGSVPLPSDFLLDGTGHISATASQAFGPLASGMRTLDGFSTTAMIIAQTSGPVDVASLAGNVLLYKLDLVAKTATLVKDASTGPGAGYVLEPPQLDGSCGGTTATTTACVIGLQPAVPVPLSATNTLALPPLDENTEYAVLITNGVKDSTVGTGISRNTITSILTFTHPLADSTGHSLLPGIDDPTAAGLELMRQVLQLPIASSGIAPTNIAAAYTFRTQTVTGKNSFDATLALKPNTDPGALGLAALPYQIQAANAAAYTPGAITPAATLTADQAFKKYGIEETAPAVPMTSIDTVLEVPIPLISFLSNSTGAFDATALSTGQGTVTPVTALVALPSVANTSVPACPGGLGLPPGVKCPRLVVFHHGLGSTKAAMLTVANELNAQGFAVAAIDAPLHGDRAYCNANAKVNECSAGGTCTPNSALASQGDSTPPGTCSTGLAHVPQLCATSGSTCVADWAAAGGNSGQTLASAEYFVSGNFFRTRDVNRQGVIDNSGLILALSPTSAGAPNSFQRALLAKGLFIMPPAPNDVGNVSWEGQSYGSIMGAVNAAVNPRIAKAVLNVGGGTQVDIFSTKGSTFRPRLEALLSSLGVFFDPVTHDPTPATAGLYLKFLNIAKWILDPSDPINFAAYVTDGTKTLPNLLLKQAHQTAKPTLGQLAECDATVPNPTNAELYLNMGLGPLYNGTNPSTSANNTTFIELSNAGATCVGTSSASAGTLQHGFLTTWGLSYSGSPMVSSYDATANTLTKDAQDQAAAFLANGTLPANSDAK